MIAWFFGTLNMTILQHNKHSIMKYLLTLTRTALLGKI